MNDYVKTNIFNVGVYVRLSREDEDRNGNDSESIKNQKDYILKYVIENGFNLIQIYCDDGYSGTNFNRPGFNNMIQDIENGKINMVITKDLSRLGRDHIDTGNYLEKYFPLHRVRYVAINDGYDSFDKNGYANDFAPFKNVFNDMYAKDISKKVRTSFHTKQLKGQYLGTSAPIGYKKDTNNKGRLLIDDETSIIVKRIFREFLSGKSINNITINLIKDKISTPSEFANIANTQKIVKGAWNSITVRRILKNEVYIGNTIQNKKQKISYKIKKQISIDKDEWIKVLDTHENIISKEDFEKVQNILDKRSYIPKKGTTHLLTGFIYCENCNAKYSFVNAYRKNSYYAICRNVKAYGRKLDICNSKTIKEDVLEDLVISSIREISKKYANEQYILKNITKQNISNLENELTKEKQKILILLENSNNILFNLYKDKSNGIIDYTTFLEFSNKISEEKNTYSNRIKNIDLELEKINSDLKTNNCLSSILKTFLEFKTIDRNILSQIIDKITINTCSEKKKITIYFKFNITVDKEI